MAQSRTTEISLVLAEISVFNVLDTLSICAREKEGQLRTWCRHPRLFDIPCNWQAGCLVAREGKRDRAVLVSPCGPHPTVWSSTRRLRGEFRSADKRIGTKGTSYRNPHPASSANRIASERIFLWSRCV